jgi:hypothetical protein
MVDLSSLAVWLVIKRALSTEATMAELKDCSDKVTLNDVEIRRLSDLLHYKKKTAQHLVLGQFGCAIGSGAIVKIDGEEFDITDYESW